jgi:hypothetical protein
MKGASTPLWPQNHPPVIRPVVSKHLKEVFSEAPRRSKTCLHFAVGLLHKPTIKEVEGAFVALIFHVCHIIPQSPLYAFGTEFDVAIFGDKRFICPFFEATPAFDGRTQNEWRTGVFGIELFGGDVWETLDLVLRGYV